MLQAKSHTSPWKSPGPKPWSPKISPRVSPARLQGFEPRLLEPDDTMLDESNPRTASASSAHRISASLQPAQSIFSLTQALATQQAASTGHTQASDAHQRVLQHNRAQASDAQQRIVHPGTAQASDAETSCPTESPEASSPNRLIQTVGSYRIADFDDDEEEQEQRDGSAAALDAGPNGVAGNLFIDGASARLAAGHEGRPNTSAGIQVLSCSHILEYLLHPSTAQHLDAACEMLYASR